MATNPNYYAILGIHDFAGEDEIKRAYRKLAFKYHPDRNPGDKFAEDKFKKITEAYRILSDAKKRADYDRARTAPPGESGAYTPPRPHYSHFDEVFNIFDNFSTGRSAARHKHQKTRGGDLKSALSISFEESILGTTAVVEVNRLEQCSRCNGTGIEPRTYPMLCPTCLGKGRIRQSHGFLGFTQVCHECEGTGRVYQKSCTQCRGDSRVAQQRKISVKIPPNVHHGTTLKIAGEGESGMYGGTPGDLYINVEVRSHENFERKEHDIWYELPLSITQAALGTVVEIPTLDGKVRIRIPSGTQPDRVFRLSKKGVPFSSNGNRGDLLVKVKVQIPTQLSSRQRKLLEEFAHASDAQPKRSTSNLFQASKGGLSAWLKSLFGKITKSEK